MNIGSSVLHVAYDGRTMKLHVIVMDLPIVLIYLWTSFNFQCYHDGGMNKIEWQFHFDLLKLSFTPIVLNKSNNEIAWNEIKSDKNETCIQLLVSFYSPFRSFLRRIKHTVNGIVNVWSHQRTGDQQRNEKGWGQIPLSHGLFLRGSFFSFLFCFFGGCPKFGSSSPFLLWRLNQIFTQKKNEDWIITQFTHIDDKSLSLVKRSRPHTWTILIHI